MDLSRLERAAPVKEQYGPSLPALLAHRIDSVSRLVVRIAAVGAFVAIIAIILIAMRLSDPTFSYHGRDVSFTTIYPRALTKEPTHPGGPVLALEQHSSVGLEASFQVTLLHLPSYGGEISGLLPIVASNMIARLERSDPSFIPVSRGRTRINFVPGYAFTYQRTIAGRVFWGRDVLITPQISGDRVGLLISMLTDPTPILPLATKPVTPDSVGSVGVLFEPYERMHISR